ncbi:MAG: glycosyltransferase family 4 protein, partial [Phycisphaerae bacterium]
RAGRVDIIHAHNGRTHLLAVAAVKRAGRGQVVATQHFLAPNRTGRHGPKAALANRLHRWAEKNTTAFIAISNAVRDQMLLRGDAPAEKITVVHNGTGDPEASNPERIAALRAELGVGENVMVFCAARLQKEKDIPTLIKAFAALRFKDQRSMSNDQKLGDHDGFTTTTQRHEGGGDGVTGYGLQGEAAAVAARNPEFRTLHSEGNEAATNNEQRTTNNGVDPSRLARDKLLTQISQINDASRQVYPAGQNSSAALPNLSRFEVLGSNSCARLFIAGEGDQRAECERLIAALRFNDQRSMSNDQKLGDGDAGDAAKNSEFRTLHSEGNEDAAEIESAALPKHSGFEVLGSSSLSSAALPQALISDQCSLVIEKDAHGIALLGFRSDVSALMSACDIFVLPAPAEPFGLVLIEAMALGKPVIAAAAGGPLEIVADGETGLLFEPGNAESLAQAIKRLLADPELRQRMGEAGRKRYEEHFTARRMASDVLAAYAAASREPREVRS